MSTPTVPASTTPGAPLETRKSTWRRLIEDRQAVISGSVLLVLITAGLLSPWIAPYDPNYANIGAINLPMFSDGYVLGTDQFGRDILSRLMHSVNTATFSAVIGVSIALVLGTVFGLIGGYFDRLRSSTEWLFTLIMTFPGMLLLILVMPLTKGDYRYTMAIFGVLLSPGVYRIVRNLTVGVSRELYVDAARVSGVKTFSILSRHVLGVVRGPIIVAVAFLAGSAINVQSALAFLGVGNKSIPSLGAMIAEGFRNLYIVPTQYLWPALTLGVLTGAFVLFGNALRDTFEGTQPKAQKVNAVALAAGFEAEDVDDAEGALLQVRDLGIAYRSPSGELNEVVKGVNLTIKPGETVGLVGESGSGKTQTAFGVLGVLPAGAVVTRGSVKLEGNELLALREQELRALRGSAMAYIPQEPMSNLDPVYTVGSQMVEAIRVKSKVSKKAASAQALSLLERVGIPDPERTFRAYPHEISGGMAQRVLIASAIANKPKLLIADEPTTALDVTVQAEILDLLRDLQKEMGMAIILVTHNFGVVADMCSRIAVMKTGEVVERGNILEVFDDPQHEYTRMLLDSILDEDSVREENDLPATSGRTAP